MRPPPSTTSTSGRQPTSTALTHALTGASIPFRWDGNVLLVGTSDEGVVDELLDEIETGEYVDVDAEPSTAVAASSSRSRR